MLLKNKLWFTLIETLIALTIIAILSLVTILSLWDIPKKTIDTRNIISNVVLNWAIDKYIIDNWTLIIPRDYQTIKDDNWNILWYQWYLSEDILKQYNIFDNLSLTNNIDKIYYSIDVNKKKYQIGMFNDKEIGFNIIGKTYANNENIWKIYNILWNYEWFLINNSWWIINIYKSNSLFKLDDNWKLLQWNIFSNSNNKYNIPINWSQINGMESSIKSLDVTNLFNWEKYDILKFELINALEVDWITWNRIVNSLFKKIIFNQNVSEKTYFSICESWCDYNTLDMTFQNALEQSINSTNSWSIKKIFIKKWNYNLDDTIYITWSNISIEWESLETKIIWKNNKSLFKWYWDNWKIKDIYLDWSTNNSLSLIEWFWENLIIDNIKWIWSNLIWNIPIKIIGWSFIESSNFNDINSIYYLFNHNNLKKWVRLLNSTIESSLNSTLIDIKLNNWFNIENNTLNWKLSIDFSKNWNIINNTFPSSSNDAIEILTPSNNINIKNNIIVNVIWNWIVIKPQILNWIPNWLEEFNFKIYWNNINTTSWNGIYINVWNWNNTPISINSLNLEKNIIKNTWKNWIKLISLDWLDLWDINHNLYSIKSINILSNNIEDINRDWLWWWSDAWISFEDSSIENTSIQNIRNILIESNSIIDNWKILNNDINFNTIINNNLIPLVKNWNNYNNLEVIPSITSITNDKWLLYTSNWNFLNTWLSIWDNIYYNIDWNYKWYKIETIDSNNIVLINNKMNYWIRFDYFSPIESPILINNNISWSFIWNKNF